MLIAGGASIPLRGSHTLTVNDFWRGQRVEDNARSTWDRLAQRTRELLREFILKRCNPVTAEAPELVAAAVLASPAMPQ